MIVAIWQNNYISIIECPKTGQLSCYCLFDIFMKEVSNKLFILIIILMIPRTKRVIWIEHSLRYQSDKSEIHYTSHLSKEEKSELKIKLVLALVLSFKHSCTRCMLHGKWIFCYTKSSSCSHRCIHLDRSSGWFHSTGTDRVNHHLVPS